MAGKEWFGVERSTFSWGPIIDEEKCTQCGLCLLSCGAGVFGYSGSKKTFRVINFGSCTMGCTTCGKVCPESAISFPDSSRTFMHSAVVKGKIFPKVKEALALRLEKFPDHVQHLKSEEK
jgi:NAD-dependent dihydropyrimidine dehydrogenase PreA subunit